jgi:hypothetical protein
MGRNKNKNPTYSNWQDIYNNLKELFLTSFKWESLPPTVNERFLELSLFDYGQVAFFRDELLGYLALKSSLNGSLNVYYEPTSIIAYGGGSYQKQLTNNKDCIIIYNNTVRDTPQRRLMDYAKRIYNIEKTIDINIHGQRTPILIKTSKKQELTIKNLYSQYEDYEPVVIVDEDLDISKLSVLNTNSPFVADKLEEQKRKLWNEALSFIGIENNFSEKNERLTANEVMVSNGLAISNRNSKLQAREKACEMINELFGLNVSVSVSNLSILEIEGGGDFE